MHCTNSRRWLGLSLLFSLVLLPLGLTKAEDKKANTDVHLKTVWAKLEAAVEAGEPTEEEAKAKWVAIKKGACGKPRK